MTDKTRQNAFRLIFFSLTSFAIATSAYYLLWLLMPNHRVFGTWFRMTLYHDKHPIQFIAIPCFFYGLVATLFSNRFRTQSNTRQILSTLTIAVLTILLSSPIGGMLWHYYDMKAGHFPTDWISDMINKGTTMGLSIGWLIIALSIPYNIFGLAVAYFLTLTGSNRFSAKPST